MFDINGVDKLSMESVESREAIIRHYAKDPRALFFISHSGGRDSQILAITVQRLVPANQIIYVHAHLGEVEHDGVLEHIERYKPSFTPFYVVENERQDFFDLVLLRFRFPSARIRLCTSTLKTGPIDKLIRKVMKERGATVGFNCIGIRAEESRQRAMKNPLWVNKRLTIKSRTVFDWLPVFHMKADGPEGVFAGIKQAGQEPFHIYGKRNMDGTLVDPNEVVNTRTSCRFCVLGNKNDIGNAATWYPDHYAKIVALERVTGHSMFFKTVKKQGVPVSVVEKAGVPVDEVAVRRHMKTLEARHKELLARKAAEEAEKAAKKTAKTKGAKQIDTHTIEMFG
ncbi:phosphoadenosine phosphosulfate reductase [Alteromonas gilva]|uniref:Phosphoadenosine phosphosulfate reductase n=1 Tax=Alteromonas gilva TaxID=2987522 RepID=A0ABT5L706_9ALTE|nr:phosphoadenosine phosphosulfate reductase [Alteromonas gilva]MDC8832830.1 phosphoadenosine phosphosulfate reductase [Alteromonas gilva]